MPPISGIKYMYECIFLLCVQNSLGCLATSTQEKLDCFFTLALFRCADIANIALVNSVLLGYIGCYKAEIRHGIPYLCKSLHTHIHTTTFEI
jgi:hypothetical protein